MDTGLLPGNWDGSKHRQFNISEQNKAVDSKRGLCGGLHNSNKSKKILCAGRYCVYSQQTVDRKQQACTCTQDAKSIHQWGKMKKNRSQIDGNNLKIGSD